LDTSIQIHIETVLDRNERDIRGQARKDRDVVIAFGAQENNRLGRHFPIVERDKFRWQRWAAIDAHAMFAAPSNLFGIGFDKDDRKAGRQETVADCAPNSPCPDDED
jgi:hypothetical protein